MELADQLSQLVKLSPYLLVGISVPENGLQKLTNLLVNRLNEHTVGEDPLYHPAGGHHQNIVGNLPYHRKIIADKQVRKC